MTRLVLAIGLTLIANTCGSTRTSEPQKRVVISALESPENKPSLAEIDLSKIGHINPKGRVQDKEYHELKVVDQLLANGKGSIPYLISKLDDGTVIHDDVMDYWPQITIGDVAFIILSDFSLDSTWKKETIPGTAFAELFETKSNPDVPFWEEFDTQVRKRGRPWLKAKWQKIWMTYKDRIVWDEHERCFKVG